MQKNHFYLGNQFAENKKFSPRSLNFSGIEYPQYEDRKAHASELKRQYSDAFEDAIRRQESLIKQGQHSAGGAYLDFTVPQDMIPNSLDTKQGARIMNLRENQTKDNVDVTVFIKKEHKNWLYKKADDFATLTTEKGKPRNERLIAPIKNIASADILSLYESKNDFDNLNSTENLLFELWISKNNDYDVKHVSSVLSELHIECDTEQRLQFDDIDIFLIKTNKNALTLLPLHLAYISEIRKYRQPSILTGSNETSREWTELFANELHYDNRGVLVGILDSGVNNAHRLLAPALPDSRMASAINVQDNLDHSDHGTGMAGLALLGDLTNAAYNREELPVIDYGLVSVKIFEYGNTTDPKFYGAVIEDAINQSQAMGAFIGCMAVTDSVSLDGKPTSSSAALDESIYHDGACDRLVIVCAGNVEPPDVDAYNYIESCKANALLSPSQSWNALTVGAYTERSVAKDRKAIVLAPPKSLSPLSRTSYAWKEERPKPEIVMEGGNLIYSQLFGITTDEDLSLITTSNDLQQSLESFQATSAATALAARLAAKIKVTNPKLSLLSIRALMVHSANWTSEMNKIGSGKPQDIMPLCGYGVPDEGIAEFSNEKCATFIFENEIIPYKRESSNTYNNMQFYDLPWPTELLESMQDESVTLRITLSYYVKPAPGKAGKKNKYRYPSATLRFDVKTPTETDQEFLARHSKLEGDSTSDNNTARWNIGQQRRERGTVQSDWFTSTAQELASCGKIVVFPGPGWWKERKLDNVDNIVKYSLVVSIQTQETEVYQAVETAIANRIAIPINI